MARQVSQATLKVKLPLLLRCLYIDKLNESHGEFRRSSYCLTTFVLMPFSPFEISTFVLLCFLVFIFIAKIAICGIYLKRKHLQLSFFYVPIQPLKKRNKVAFTKHSIFLDKTNESEWKKKRKEGRMNDSWLSFIITFNYNKTGRLGSGKISIKRLLRICGPILSIL